ncbi:transcriptional regulator, MarR family protein [Rhodobacteraceae bacterium HTCC2150]|nr:transcriptional regulator, MarR family protein [Rhodobacteraceae bacterium HTCC2150]
MAGHPLVESQSLALTQSTQMFRERMVAWLISRLSDDGFDGLKANQLTFLGSLDCGVNYAAALARSLGISRQAVHKTVKEMEKYGWLATRPDETLKNQRVIVFTAEGERMMARAREYFLELDDQLIQKFGQENLAELQNLLAFDPSA